jgi:hypothetical protein
MKATNMASHTDRFLRALEESPPILGGIEARKSFGSGKVRLQAQDGQALPRSATP